MYRERFGTYIHIYIYVCIHVNVYVYVYVGVCIHVHIWISTATSSSIAQVSAALQRRLPSLGPLSAQGFQACFTKEDSFNLLGLPLVVSGRFLKAEIP